MEAPSPLPPPPQSRWVIFQRGCEGKCPRCAAPGVFLSKYRLHPRCPSCGLPLEMEDGWSYGSVPLAYILACLVWVLPVVLLFFFGWISLAVAALVGVLGVIILPVVTFRLTKRIWIGTYYALLPFEMRYRKPGEKGDAH